jgi:hypothetical protein
MAVTQLHGRIVDIHPDDFDGSENARSAGSQARPWFGHLMACRRISKTLTDETLHLEDAAQAHGALHHGDAADRLEQQRLSVFIRQRISARTAMAE